MCCLVVVSWKGDHPAMSPQSCRSEVHRLFSLLLRVGCVSVSTSGLGWDSNLLRWSLTLREKRRLRVFDNRVLRRILVPKRDGAPE